MPSSGSRSFGRAVGAIALVHLLWGGFYVWRTSFVVDGTRVFLLWDDSMISMRYARNLFEGFGPVWNAGEEAVQGFTNLGLMLVMAATHALPLGVEKAALPIQALGVLVAALAGVGTASWVRATSLARDDSFATVAARSPLSDALGIAAALACAALAPLSIWGAQGGEGAWVAAWLAWLLVGVARAPVGGAWPGWTYPWLVVGPFLRADAALLAGAVVASAVVTLRGRELLRHALKSGAWLGAVGVALLVFGALVYGDPLPNTFHLKAVGMDASMLRAHAWKYLAPALPHLAVALALAGVCIWKRWRAPAVAAAGAALAAGLGWEFQVGGDWVLHYHRFSTPVLPALLGLALLGASELFAWLRAKPLRLCVVGLALGIATAEWEPTREWLDPRAPTLLSEEARDLYQLGTYLRGHSAESTRIAVHWAGIIPYVSGRPSLDVLGKSDRRIAHSPARLMKPGHAKWDWDYVLREQRPDLFLSVSRGVDRHPLFQEDYYYVVRNKDKRLFFVRKDALAKFHDRDVTILQMPGKTSIAPLPLSRWTE